MEIVIRAATAFIILWLVTRAAGRSTLGELSSFELVLFVVLGDLVQQGITMEDRSLTGSLLAVFTMVVLAAALNFANMRWPKLGKLMQGRPIVLIRDGVLDRKALHNERIGLDELSMLARQAGIENYSSIRLAILEASGKISFFTQEAESRP
ncbi:uncharacterized membrane protein YcaP (DUF421 family) [Arthrobacter sp. JUb119]|uniref:DUF421 domain-containing protein n=1 Tax=Micrococcaceae TaxID=1268 RepID=UPI000FA9E628|nr:YetF domain-containing protein [Arthrobacter sp. JUb115]MCS3493191.1 uncharacterized membrane protein YcaP (DUF421 family) [Arthrobacter sp. JUb119]TDU21792.1 uncharacterized protein DUF421 [Arthrobacter sp. JUb115]